MTSHPHRRSVAWGIAKWLGSALCLMTIAMWALSLFCGAELMIDDVFVWVNKGDMGIAWTPRWNPTQTVKIDVGPPLGSGVFGTAPSFWFVPRIGLESTVPLWIVLGLTGIPTALLWRSCRRRTYPGHCEICGYDLRGSPSDRCPECGERI